MSDNGITVDVEIKNIDDTSSISHAERQNSSELNNTDIISQTNISSDADADVELLGSTIAESGGLIL